MLPSAFVGLDRREKAAVIAFVDIKLEKDKKDAQKQKRIKGRKR